MPSDRPRGCQRLSALASHVRRRCLCCEAQPSIADAAVHGGIQMDPEKAMAEMNERDKFMLDCMGYLVVPEFLTHAEVDALNDAFDANWHRCELGAGNAKRRAIDQFRGMLAWPQPHAACAAFPRSHRAPEVDTDPQHDIWPRLATRPEPVHVHVQSRLH